jgi:hypothetical protein
MDWPEGRDGRGNATETTILRVRLRRSVDGRREDVLDVEGLLAPMAEPNRNLLERLGGLEVAQETSRGDMEREKSEWLEDLRALFAHVQEWLEPAVKERLVEITLALTEMEEPIRRFHLGGPRTEDVELTADTLGDLLSELIKDE